MTSRAGARRSPPGARRPAAGVIAALAAVGAAAVLCLLALRQTTAVQTRRSQLPEPSGAAAERQTLTRGLKQINGWFREADGLTQRHGEMWPAESFRLFATDEYPQVPRFKCMLHSEARSAFVLDHSQVLEKRIIPQPGQSLLFATAAIFREGGDKDDRVEFTLRALPEGGGERTLFTRAWERTSQSSGWETASADLGDYVGRPVTLKFETVLRRTGQQGEPALLFLLSDPRLADRSSNTRPNVLLVTIETTRRDHMSLYGYRRRTTPFLEELGQEAIVFENAYAQSSWTRPSVACILTGLYPSQIGVFHMLDALPESAPTLARILRGRGYVTGAFIPWPWSALSALVFGCHQGFDLLSERPGIVLNGKPAAAEWLDAEKPSPFFLWLHMIDPHDPYDAPEPFKNVFVSPDYRGPLREWQTLGLDQLLAAKNISPQDLDYVHARYDAEILYTDRLLERLARELKARGLWSNTLVVVMADHGEEFFEHGSWGHTGFLWPEKLRVPLLIKLPDSANGARVGGVAGGVDVAPTVLGALGLPPSKNMQGRDLLRDAVTRRFHFAEYRDFSSNLSRADYSTEIPKPPQCSIISERYQYIWNAEDGQEFLYDLQEDPTARHNLAKARPETVAEFASMMRERYRSGYTIAFNGDGRRRRLSGTVHCDAPIVRMERLRTRNGDVLQLDEDKKALRFDLTAEDGDAVFRFQTAPANAPVTIAFNGDGRSPVPVYLGSADTPSPETPVAIAARRCAADMDFRRAPAYSPGKKAALYIWREGTPFSHLERPAEPDEDTLNSLKALGYL